MTRVRNILIALLLVTALVYVGLKGYIYYQVKSSLDQAAAAAAPMAEISYGGIGSSLRGSVTVEDVTIRAFGDEVRVAAVRVGTPNVLVLLGAISELQQGEAPEFLELELSNLALGLNGPLMNFVQSAVQSSAPRLPTSYPCAGQVAFGPVSWRAMGYQQLISDAFVRVDVDQGGRSVRVQSRWHTHDMGTLRAAAEVAGIAPSFSSSFAQAPQPGAALLRWFEIDYEDRSYYKRWVQYCARRDKTSPAKFIASVVDADPTYYMYTWGVVPGEGLRKAYGEFLRAPQTVSAVARPGTPLELAHVQHYSPDDLIALLDLRVVVNGHGVASKVAYRPELLNKYKAAPKPSLQWPPAQAPLPSARAPGPAAPRQAAPAAPAQAPVRAPEASAPTTPAPVAKAPAVSHSEPKVAESRVRQAKTREFGYRRVGRDGLERHVGRYVRVVTADGTEREGILSEVRGSDVVVEHRMYGGSMAVPVPVSQINRIEVWLPQDS